ncbi:type II secretion system F family protein [Streptomyces lavendulae]|uniref:type II secretion system F family protein n=1 Tax=Streptomyces lavendulae TaxID=1914 RepID=UPI0031E67695
MGGPVVHRLGTALCLAVPVWCLVSGWALWLRRRASRRRLARLFPARAAASGPGLGPRVRASRAVRAGPGGLGGPAGPGGVLPGRRVAGGASPGGPVRARGAPDVPIGGVAEAESGLRGFLARSRSRSPAGADPREAERQLPFAADLLAACLAAGAGPVEAAEVVGESLGGPVGERLALAGAELRLGGEPGAAWGRLARIPGARGLAECLERAARTGAPVAEPVSRLAAGLRADRSRRAVAAAQRAAVLVTAPVGLCFLPAFLAIGVAPVVIGMASGLLSGK